PKANDVLALGPAAVVLDLVVGLRRTLWGKQVRSGRERPDVDAHWIIRKRQPRPARRINDLVLELQVRIAQAVREVALQEVSAHHILPGDVLAVVNLVARGEKRCEGGTGEVAEPVEELRIAAE